MAESPNMRIPGNDPDRPDFARRVAELLDDRMQRRRFRRGELLWREGDTTGMLVALQRGQVRIYRLMPRGKAVTLFLFGPGEVFGFLPFFDGSGGLTIFPFLGRRGLPTLRVLPGGSGAG